MELKVKEQLAVPTKLYFDGIVVFIQSQKTITGSQYGYLFCKVLLGSIKKWCHNIFSINSSAGNIKPIINNFNFTR